MVALQIVLIGLLVMLIMVGVLLISSGLYGLLAPLIALVPLLAMVFSVALGAVELLLFLGSKDDKKVAKRDIRYLGATFLVSGVLFWLSTLIVGRV